MRETTSWQLKRANYTIYAAYVAALLFAIHLVTYLIPTIRDATTSSAPIVAELLALLAVAEHLLVFPLIEALPAPRWARYAGYGWLVIDIATDIMQLNGTPAITYLPMRYGGHVSAALWIASGAYESRGAMRVSGLLLAFDLAIYSFIAFIPLTFIALLPSLVLLPLWFLMIGRLLSRSHALESAQFASGEKLPDKFRYGEEEHR